MKTSLKYLLSLIITLTTIKVSAQWTVQHFEGNSRFNIIKFRSENRGFLFGDNSLILKTEDGGENWNSIDPGIDIFFQDFQFIDDTTLIASGYYSEGTVESIESKILLSEDDGLTWKVISNDSDMQWLSQWFFDANIGLIAGFNTISKTTDQGQTWNDVWKEDIGQISQLFFVTDSIGFAMGVDFTSHILMKTVDQGSSWTVIETFDSELKSIFFTDENIGYVGTNSKIISTQDGGANWSEYDLAGGQTVLSIDFISPSVGFVVSSEICPCLLSSFNSFETSISKTTDGGEFWETISKAGTFYSIDFLTETNGYISGDGNLIMQLNGNGLGDFPDDYPWVPNGINEYQWSPPYPNPADNQITLKIPNPEFLQSIKLLSVAGKEYHMNFLIEENQVRLDLTGVADGIYFIVLALKDQTKSFRIIKRR